MPKHTTPIILPHARYWDPQDFQAELDIFETSIWNMVGLTGDVAGDNDYLTVIIGGKSVIIQNFKGELRAFDNVCAHRFSRIRSEEKGNGLLRCPYHSWVYNKDGCPVAIPHENEAFGFDQSEREQTHLKRWSLELCGQFIFIRGNEVGPNLRVSLGETFDDLAALSKALGNEVDTFVSEYDANWKVCVENTLDDYHGQFVHPTTFHPMLSGEFFYSYEGHQSMMKAGITEKSMAKWRRIAHHFDSRSIKTDNYYHYLIFPLLTVASTFGVSFSLQTFRPLAPNRTLLTSRLFLGKLDGGGGAIEEAMASSAKSFNRTVFLEDKFVCEQVQRGLQQKGAPPGILGKFERRLAHFQKSATEIFSYR